MVGPPGTSKSWYADEVAKKLTGGDTTRVRSVQFHPSYQYEDFVEGFVPNSSGGFDPTRKHFRLLCEAASENSENLYVLVIDEISRCDAARVFGEALTYLESSKRGQTFQLASGSEMSIPANVFILATMNPWDRGVDEMDVALDRRFAHIEMPPRVDLLASLLAESEISEAQEAGLIKFFEEVQKHYNPMCHIGHAYFARVTDGESLARLWRFQLKHVFTRALREDVEELRKIEAIWRQLVERADLVGVPQAEDSTQSGGA